MSETELEQLRYPVGKYARPAEGETFRKAEYLQILRDFPGRIKQETAALNDSQLDTPYRPGGWTLRQLVHHCADSHINAFTRFKLALTEDKPVIKPYFEALWAEIEEARTLPIAPSISILEGLHQRWTALIASMTPADMQKSFFHPQKNRYSTLEETTALYAWHCRHHLAHITSLKARNGW